MGRLRAQVLALAAVLVVLGLTAGSASAQQPPGPDGGGSDFFVTIGARQCPSYEAIRANRARNNIQESLRDLGADTPYKDGQPVDPAIEQSTQPDCTPITAWRFTLGKGIAPGKVVGPWGSLSVVSSPFPTDVTTQASVPDRDGQGRPLAGTSVAGATTIELTEEQAKLAEASSRLWIQGGTTTDPVLADVPAFADEFGFGALRCAIDNLNGDNVEWIKFPAGSRHVYCFAYYVTPPPTSGTIVIRKEVSDPPQADHTFTFEGNISYTSDGRFPLVVSKGKPAAATFYRAATGPGDEPWTVRELVPAGWRLTGLSCTANGSVVQTDPPNAAVAIRLLAGDTVTCTYTDALRPPPGHLLIRKVTTGAVGTFPFGVRPADGGDLLRATATTTEEDVAVDAEPGPFDLDAGTYRVAERLPAARGGRWHQAAVNCNARRAARSAPTEVTITAGGGVVCLFENVFIPSGSIAIAKVTRGGTGATGFIVTPLADPGRQYVKRAATRVAGRPALARGDATRRLPLGRYVIHETGTVSEQDGRWTLVSVRCAGEQRPFAQGRVVVELTREQPDLACRFLNEFTTDTQPLPEPEPPATPVEPGTAAAARPDLVVTKRALRSRVRLGSVARFEVTVRNAGAAAAEEVVVGDLPNLHGRLVSGRARPGDCDDRILMICRIGLLGPGEATTIRVGVRATGGPSLLNRVVAGSSTPEERLDNNIARSPVRVRPRAGGPCPRIARTAHAAC